MKALLATTFGFFAITAATAPAMISFGYLSPEQAQEHGLQVRYRAAGPKDVSVTVSFPTDGRWKHFAEPVSHHYIELSLDREKDGNRTEQIFRTTLRENRRTEGRVSVYFVIERDKLHQVRIWLTQRIVDAADVVRMRDYIELDDIAREDRVAPPPPTPTGE